MNTNAQPTPTRTGTHPMLACTVLAAVLRVAGPVETGVLAHGRAEQFVTIRIGDLVVHLADAYAAARIRQRWDASVGDALRLRERVSQTWLAPRPGTYPAAISLQLTRHVAVSSRFVPTDVDRRVPTHVEVRMDQLVWQVCDMTAWRAIGDAWLSAYELLQQ